MLTYDVQIWGIRKRPDRAKPYQFRWRVGPQPHSKSYLLKAQADGRRSELMEALRKREQFDTTTGLPASELHALNSPTWYQHACDYARMKWPDAAAKHRASIADALATITPRLVKDMRGAPTAPVLRAALYSWAFRFALDEQGELQPRHALEVASEEIKAALNWISRRSVNITDLNSPSVVRTALQALALKQDGTKAAPNTIHRKHTVFSNALRYAVERELLTTIPLGKVDWQPPETDDEVDFRFVPSPRQARALLEAVGGHGEPGSRLKAFFGCIYYAAMRPAEVTSLRESDCDLSEEGWGELLLAGSSPRIGSGWTDSGKSYDQRGLKRRASNAVRSVPIPPVLVAMLREHIKTHGVAPDGRLFRAHQGGHVLSKEYGEVWQKARKATLTEAESASPLADVPYSLRHACVSLWLSSGVEPTEVARRAGHSVAVLFRFYAKVIHGRKQEDNNRIDRALSEGADDAP